MQTVEQSLRNRLPAAQNVSPECRAIDAGESRVGSVGLSEAHSRARKAEQSLEQFERRINRLEWQVIRDSLTGVYNRRFLLEALDKEVARCCRYGEPIGLLVCRCGRVQAVERHLGAFGGRPGAPANRGGFGRDACGLRTFWPATAGKNLWSCPTGPSKRGIVQLAERLRKAVEQNAGARRKAARSR